MVPAAEPSRNWARGALALQAEVDLVRGRQPRRELAVEQREGQLRPVGDDEVLVGLLQRVGQLPDSGRRLREEGVAAVAEAVRDLVVADLHPPAPGDVVGEAVEAVALAAVDDLEAQLPQAVAGESREREQADPEARREVAVLLELGRVVVDVEGVALDDEGREVEGELLAPGGAGRPEEGENGARREQRT